MKRVKFIIFLVLIVGAVIFVNEEVIYLPLLEINAPNSEAIKVKDEIGKTSFMGLTFKRNIRNENFKKIVNNYKITSLSKRGFLKWEIDISQEVCNYIVKLNGYPMSINKDGFLIDENENMNISDNSLAVFIVNVKAKNDAKVVYNDYIRQFLLYINSAKSKLYPIISEVNFDDTIGLSFVCFDKKRIIIGKRKDFKAIEDDFFKVKSLLIEKKEYTNYSELDFRFKNRIICRKK